MDRKEMLKKMGLSENQLKHLLETFRHFYQGLEPAEKAVIRRSLPTLEEAARSFDHGIKAGDLEVLFETSSSGASFNSEIAVVQPSSGPDD
jgi:hypothetical protein